MHLILQLEQRENLIFHGVVVLLPALNLVFFILDMAFEFNNVRVLIGDIGLEVCIALPEVGGLHETVLCYQLVFEVFEKAVVDFFEGKHVLIVIREGNALSDH
jgi:hypothetical protein